MACKLAIEIINAIKVDPKEDDKDQVGKMSLICWSCWGCFWASDDGGLTRQCNMEQTSSTILVLTAMIP
jgi:hypothetical protein